MEKTRQKVIDLAPFERFLQSIASSSVKEVFTLRTVPLDADRFAFGRQPVASLDALGTEGSIQIRVVQPAAS